MRETTTTTSFASLMTKDVRSNNAMQRSARVGTPLAGTGPGKDRLRSTSGAPTRAAADRGR